MRVEERVPAAGTRSAWRGVGMVVALAVAAHADPVFIWQSGFESADTCAWVPTEPTTTCDPEMIFVPAGPVTLGSDDGEPYEKPVRTVNLSAYWIDRNEVTVAAYAECVSGGACSAPTGSHPHAPSCNWGSPRARSHPINCVDWYHGQAYCAWRGKRYPTEAEWEKAARGTDERTHPWGEAIPTCDYAVRYDVDAGGFACDRNSTWPVGSKPAGASPYGAVDMAGNVWECVNDWFHPSYYSVSPVDNPPGLDPGHYVVKSLRGGGWDTLHDHLRAWSREAGEPTGWGYHTGFRCARAG